MPCVLVIADGFRPVGAGRTLGHSSSWLCDPDLDIWIVNQWKDPINVFNDLNTGYGSNLELGSDAKINLYFVNIYDDGFEILLDRLAGLLFVLNFLLWLGLRYLNLRSPSSEQL